MKSTYSVSEAQKQLPKLIRSDDVIGIMRHTELAAFLVPRERWESLMETLATLANPESMAAIKKYESGKMKFRPWKEVKRELENEK